MPATETTQANVEYFFRLLYDCLHGSCYGGMASLSALLAHLWIWIVIIGYAIAVIGLFIVIYATVRLFELREREREFYTTLINAPTAEIGSNPRWRHIESLMESDRSGDWREAIVEADILLDVLLTRQGYAGDGVGEKLKNADQTEFKTLSDAWEAHKVRNQIAHEGSAFDLQETLARRTIARYENVFREFNLI